MAARAAAWLGVLALAGVLPAAAQNTGRRFFGRVEVGALNPDAWDEVTMAAGLTGGVHYRRHVASLQLLWQSQNGNSTTDLGGDARTFALLTYEYLGREQPQKKRDFFLRASGGLAMRSPWNPAMAVGGGAGVRYRVTQTLTFLASFTDIIAFLPEETINVCQPPPSTFCQSYAADAGPQHNFGLTMAFEVRQR
jgi:hypothetical protein